MTALLEKYGSLIDEEEKTFYDAAESAWTAYNQADELMALAEQRKTEEARKLLEGECVELYNSVTASLSDIIEYNTQGSVQAAEEGTVLYRTSIFVQTIVNVLLMTVLIYFSL